MAGCLRPESRRSRMAQRETDDLFYRLQSVRPRPVNIWRPIRRPACTTDYRLTRQCQTDRQERMRQSPPVLLARVCRYSPVSRAWERQSQSMATRGGFCFYYFLFIFWVVFLSFFSLRNRFSAQRERPAYSVRLKRRMENQNREKERSEKRNRNRKQKQREAK